MEPQGANKMKEEKSHSMLQISKVGEGSYGIVYHAKRPKEIEGSHNNLAVKRNLKDDCVDFILSLRELDMLVKIKGHPYIIELISVSFGNPFESHSTSMNLKKGIVDDHVHFIFERATCDLHSFIYERIGIMELSDSQTMAQHLYYLKLCMVQLLLGLEFLHSQHIIHRDIKPANILCFPVGLEKQVFEPQCKLCDFGLAKIFTRQGKNTPTAVTFWYRSPEICLGDSYDYKCDIWALGCIFYEFISGKAILYDLENDNNLIILAFLISFIPETITPAILQTFKHGHLINLATIVQENKKTTWKQILDKSDAYIEKFNETEGNFEEFLDLLACMIRFSPSERNTALQCLQMPFFQHPSFKKIITQMHTLFPPQYIKLPTYINVYKCIERQWLYQIIIDIFQTRQKHRWYKDRILFMAIDLFLRYLHDLRLKAINDDAYLSFDDAHIRIIACLYIAIKFYTTIAIPISFDDLCDLLHLDKYKEKRFKAIAQDFELSFVRDTLKCQIYNDTLYEMADNYNHILVDKEISDLIYIWCHMTSIDGVCVGEVFDLYYTYFIKS